MTQPGGGRGRGSAFGLARRVGLRVLAVAGLAGAAWLLSGAAAHAAEPVPTAEATPTSVSVVGIVADLGEDLLGLENTQELLDQVLVPPTTPSTVDGNVTQRRTSRPAGQTTSQVATGTSRVAEPAAGQPPVGSSFGLDPREGVPTLARLVSTLVAPLGIVGGTTGAVDLLRPVIQLTEPVIAPLNRTIAAIRDVLRFAVTPVTAVLDVATRGGTGPVRGDEVVRSEPPVVSTADATAPVHHRAATRPGAVAEQVAALPLADQDGTPDVPAAPWPGDPLSGLLGHGTTGNPMSGSGSPHDSGSSALVPLTVAFGEVAFHPLSLTTVVGMARQLAENPTVSPD